MIASSLLLSALVGQTAWPADPAFVKMLAPRVTVAEYSFQPPKGYQKIERPGPDGSLAFAWAGPVRPDGSRSMMMLITLTTPHGEKALSAEGVAGKMVQGVQRRRTDWHQRKTETGSLGGLKFARIAWTGTEPPLGMHVQGVHYAAKDGVKYVVLWTQDFQPEGAASLKLCEAAIRTFKKG